MIQYGMEYYGTVRNNTVLSKIICVFTFSDDICLGDVFLGKQKAPAGMSTRRPSFFNKNQGFT
jgi:hypothetical protein